MTSLAPKPRWFYPTPDRLLLMLVGVECTLWLSGRFRWFAVGQQKGYPVLIAVASRRRVLGADLPLVLAELGLRPALPVRRPLSGGLDAGCGPAVHLARHGDEPGKPTARGGGERAESRRQDRL